MDWICNEDKWLPKYAFGPLKSYTFNPMETKYSKAIDHQYSLKPVMKVQIYWIGFFGIFGTSFSTLSFNKLLKIR